MGGVGPHKKLYPSMMRWHPGAHGAKLRLQEKDSSVEKFCIKISAGIKLSGKPAKNDSIEHYFSV